MSVYLDTGDRVVVRDRSTNTRQFEIIINEEHLVVPSLAVAERVYEGLRELLISHGQLDRSPDT